MEEEKILEDNSNNNNLSVIDEKPELTTFIAGSSVHDDDTQSLLSKKIKLTISKGYTLCTVMEVISYSINETSFLLPYCLRKLGIVPFIVLLIILPLLSVYIFYLILDIVIKHNLYDNYHEIIQEKTNKTFNKLFFIFNIIYNVLIIAFENYILLSICLRIISFYYNINMRNIFYVKLIILSFSMIIIEFPISFFKQFRKPDSLYIMITIFIIMINVFLLIVLLMNKSFNFINVINFNTFEPVSKDYFTSFSIIMTVIGWQSQMSTQFKHFKIKTQKRFFKVINLHFVIELILILFICFVNSPFIIDKGELILFLLDYKNRNVKNTLFIKIMSIISCILIHIIIGHHMLLTKEHFIFYIKLIIHKKAQDEYEINKIISVCFNFFILLLSNTISLFTEDIFVIIILYGGIMTPLLNYLFSTCLYCQMVSYNSIAVYLAWLIIFFHMSIGLVGFIIKLILR